MLYYFSDDVFVEIIKANSKYISLDEKIVTAAKNEMNYQKQRDWVLNQVVSLNNEGIKLEKSGMIEKAIEEYEKCMRIMYESIKNGIWKDFAWHSPNRLRILYKKLKHPHENFFLGEFISFCEKSNIEFPDIFRKQLQKI